MKKLTNSELIKPIEELETYIYNDEVLHLAHYTFPEGLDSIIKYKGNITFICIYQFS